MAHKICSPCSDPTPLAKILDGSTTCVAACDNSKGFILFASLKYCQDKEACKKFISSDGTQCTSACLSGECGLAQEAPYGKCSKDVPKGYYSYTENTQKKCVPTCPEEMIVSASDLICLAAKSDCKTVISSD